MEPTPKAADAAAVSPPNVHNGTFTLSHPERGHFTLKLYTKQGGDLDGKRIVAVLAGPDNTSDYRGVAFWNDERKLAHVWKRYRHERSKLTPDGFSWSARDWSTTEQKLAIWVDLATRGEAGFWYSEGYRMQLEGRCVVCNRKLTDPVSIETGIGPKCGGRS